MANEGSRKLSRRSFITRSLLGSAALGLGVRASAQTASQVSGSRKLGIALCGLGSYATNQLGPALRETKLCRLAGVVTGDPAKGRRWAREYGFPESSVYGYDTIHKMADNADIDILYSVTPPALHKRDTLRGFEAGKHVISEKPMAPSVADCDAMIAAAKEAGKQLSIGYRLHFHPYYKQLKELAGQHDFKKLSGGFGFRYRRDGTWRTEREMGGGPLMDIGLYVIYAAAMAKNGAMPVAVTAEEPPKEHPELFDEVEETMRFTLEYADGATCDGETSWSQPFNRFRAEAGETWFETHPAFSYSGLQGDTSKGALSGHADFNQQAHQMDAFAAAIREGRETIVPGTMGRRDIRIVEAIFEAARTGERVKL